MTGQTSILLPAAGVDLFIRDPETAAAARALAEDWRFARVTLNIVEGDVENAIAAYERAPSPALLIVETDTTDESFVSRLETLSGLCSEGTSAVIVGPVNDVNLYRSLTSMGVSDYLVRPVPQETLSEVIAGTLIDRLGAAGSHLIAMVGAKGGVGTSALAQALAWGVAEELDQKTFFLDVAGGWSSLSVGMQFDPATTLPEAARAAAARDEDTLKRMLFKAGNRLSVLASGADAMLDPSISAQQLEDILDMVMTSYPVVIVDLSGAVPSLQRTVMNRAHELIVVTTPTLPSLRSARSLMQEIKVLHGGSAEGIDLVVNMQGLAPGKEVPKADIASALECVPAAILPFDPKLFIGLESEGRNLMEDKAGYDIVSALLPLASRILPGSAESAGSDTPDSGGIGRLLSKIKPK